MDGDVVMLNIISENMASSSQRNDMQIMPIKLEKPDSDSELNDNLNPKNLTLPVNSTLKWKFIFLFILSISFSLPIDVTDAKHSIRLPGTAWTISIGQYPKSPKVFIPTDTGHFNKAADEILV